MILSRGEILGPEGAGGVLERLPVWLAETAAAEPPGPQCVVDACAALAQQVAEGAYDGVVRALIAGGTVSPAQVLAAVQYFSRESLLFKLETELGAERFPVRLTPPGAPFAIERRLAPLGVLLHIAAGNVDALPAYSVVEGLLAGNVNLLKLPQADGGLSVLLLAELVRLEPRLLPYIYVFDTPSGDLGTMGKLAALADGIVVWGGDEAVRAARRLAPPETRVVEWGHKLSFAYAVPDAPEEDLAGLARQIVSTRQLLCSSCQGVFVDTGGLAQLHAFCERFLPILDREALAAPPPEPAAQARITLMQYTARLEGSPGARLFPGARATVTACEDSALEMSLCFGNCWAKRLPRAEIVPKLRPYKGYLQTAGLLCAPADWDALSALLRRAGVSRIRTGGNMSVPIAGEAHDGEFALRRYARVVETELPGGQARRGESPGA